MTLASPAFGQADLTNCERELIHLAGSVQPHGLLLVLREPDLCVVQSSTNTEAYVGLAHGAATLGAVQAFSSLGYWAAATFWTGQAAVFGAAIFENFAAGLATAAYLAYLMSLCERRFAATQFALLSALLAVTRTLAGGASGTLAERLGYSHYFLLTFLAGLPAFALIPLLRRVGRPPEPADAAP